MMRPAHIPPKIWTMAVRTNHGGADTATILRTAEMMMRRLAGSEHPDEDKVVFWPGLTRRETRVVRDALMGHDTVIDDDVSALFRLRSVFQNQVGGEGDA